jgi:hypothetical protein
MHIEVKASLELATWLLDGSDAEKCKSPVRCEPRGIRHKNPPWFLNERKSFVMDILRSVIHVTLINIKCIYERKFVSHVTVNITQRDGLGYTIVPDISVKQ